MADKEEVLRVVKEKGPVLPAQISRELGSDTITVGALLSELARKEEILISKTKIGGSPTYYTKNQREKLQGLKEHLNDKQQKAFDLLKNKKVVRDEDQEPVIRASLRDIKDFAKPLRVEIKGKEMLYWKWYLSNDFEAEKLIREDLNMEKREAPKKKEQQKMLTEAAESPKEKKEEKKEEAEEEKEVSKDREESEEDASYLREETDDGFLIKLRKYFDRKEIEILEENSIRKGSDIEFVVNVPNPIGKQKYFCKARGKKKCNDGDLSSAYIQGQSRKLPVLFLYTGDLTKKAEGMLDEEFKGMLAKKI